MKQTDSFSSRYPQLAFLSQFVAFEKKALAKDCYAPLDLAALSDVEVIYFYGLGTGKIYTELKSWLQEKPERDLVVIEDDMAYLQQFTHSTAANAANDPQFHIRFLLEKQRLEDFCEECASDFPCSRIAVICNKDEKPFFEKMKLWLLRKTTIKEALQAETIHYHRLFKNIHSNFLLSPHAYLGNRLKGKFRNIPAIICGAGPSLEDHIEELRDVENKALIFAGGSTITALTKRGIHPHFCLAIDPNQEEYVRLESARSFEDPFFYGSRLRRDVHHLLNGPLGYLQTRTGGYAEAFLEDKLGLKEGHLDHGNHPEALSITTTAVSFAKLLGCNPIYFCGVDLAYTGGRRYASGIVEEQGIQEDTRASETLLERTDSSGEKILTLVKWVMESSWISHFAKQNPEISFYRVSEKGLGFENMRLKQLSSLLSQPSRDLRARVVSLLQAQKKIDSGIEKILENLSQSLKRSCDFCRLIIQELEKVNKKQVEEPILLTVHRMDLEQEEFYRVFLVDLEDTLKSFLKRTYRTKTDGFHKDLTLEVWQHMEKIMQEYQKTFTMR